MSPTSSDPGVTAPAEAELPAARRVAATSQRLREQRARQRFERAFWMLVAGLSAVSAVFLLLGSLQGPKLSSAVVDAARVVEQPGQQLRLFANQPLGEVAADQVTVTPAAEVSVSVQDDVLIVQFEQRLRFATEYLVEVRDVPATSRDATATFTHRFTTPGASLLYLDRGESVDEVLRSPCRSARCPRCTRSRPTARASRAPTRSASSCSTSRRRSSRDSTPPSSTASSRSAARRY